MSLVKVMKVGDLLPTLDVQLTYKDPNLVLDIAPGTTVVFTMTPVGSTTPKINRRPATVVSSAAGVVLVRYAWSGTDTDTAGDYRAEFELTLTGKDLSAPTNGFLTIRVEDVLS